MCGVHVESLRGEYARVVKVEDVLREMGVDSGDLWSALARGRKRGDFGGFD